MKRIRILIFALVFAATAMFPLFGMTACAKKKTGRYALNHTELSVLTGDDPVRLQVTRNGEPFTGAIRWNVDNALVLTAYQGYVKGIGAGTGNVTAQIEENGKTVSLPCKVTVTASAQAEIYDMTAQSGMGDIDVTLPAGWYTTGASAQVVALKDVSGNNVDKLKTAGGRTYAANGADDALAAGYYTLVYRITLNGTSNDFTRTLRVLSASRYEDAMVLDAIDGSEKMIGMSATLEYLPLLQRNEADPGAYVTYTAEGNSGYTEENGIDQNIEQFGASLASAGYNGYLRKGVAGYDTVYRMYGRKYNTPPQPLPFFYLNLKDTGGPLWRSLSSDTAANMNVWFRVWHRRDSTQSYRAVTADQWLYLFKVMNDGETNIGGAMAYTANQSGWYKSTVNLSQFAVQLQDANNIAIGVGVGDPSDVKNLQGELIFELYSVELDIPNTLSSKTGSSLDLKLHGQYSGIFDSYTFQVIDGAGRISFAGDQDHTVVTLSQNGNVGLMNGGSYTVEYTLKKGEKTLPDKFVRRIEGVS